jgi:hypothetical protein
MVVRHLMEDPVFALSAEALASLRYKWRRMVRKRKSLVELAARPPCELQRIAQDVGVSIGELRTIAASHPGPRELLPLRLQILGLDPGYVRSALTTAYRGLERACAACPAWRRCAGDLARGDVQSGMDDYCICGATLDALAVDGAGAVTWEPCLPERQSSSWPMFHRVERRAVRMHEMMTRLQVDPGKLARLRRGDAYAEARARCLSCKTSEKCLHWLAERTEAELRPEFCPNLALFEACQQDRPAS